MTNRFVNPYYIPKQRSRGLSSEWQTDPDGAFKPTAGQRINQWWGENKETMTTDKSGVGGIGAAVTSAMPSTADGQFSVDKNAGFKGSFQGLSQGGVVGAIAGGVMGQVGEFRRVNQNLDNLQTGFDGVHFDENGRAIYNGGNVAQAQQAINDLNKGEDSMALGKGLDPATWAFGGIMGTRKRIRRKRRELERSIAKAQSGYNTADVATRLKMNAMEDYQQRMDPQARLYNLYKTQFG